jgi:hypothetical protein
MGDDAAYLSMGAHYGIHQGITIPRPQCRNAMNFMGSGGPGRTRTFERFGSAPYLFRVQLQCEPG